MKAPKTNRIGLQVLDYRGGKTTLCAGCGHNAISERIIDALYEMGVQPERRDEAVAASAARRRARPTSWARSHSFNSVHGRMPSVATGAMLANHDHDRARRQRRRRYGLDRHGPVRAPDAPQSSDDLHHRRQRRLRPDQGPVLGDRRYRLQAEDRRHQRSARDRHLRARHSAGRDVRRPLLLRRQEAAARRC